MDYWCALWFWPIRGSDQLPSREQWWMEVGAILEGNVVDLTPQPQFDFALAAGSQAELLELALSQLALEDDFGARLVGRKGSIPADIDLGV